MNPSKASALLFFLLLFKSSGFGQNYLDALRPFWGMQGRGASRVVGDNVGVFDQEALLVNPAALTFITRPAIYTDLSVDHVRGSTLFLNTFSDSSIRNSFRFNELAGVYPVPVYRGSWVWAAGVQPVYQFDREAHLGFYDQTEDQLRNKDYHLFETGSLYGVSLGTGVLFKKNVSLGTTFTYLYGTNIYSQSYVEEDPNQIWNFFQRYVDSLAYTSDYKGWNLKTGIVIQFPHELLLGGTIETPAFISVDESSLKDTIQIGDFPIDDYHGFAKDHLTYKLTGPWRFGAGLSFRYTPVYFSVGYRYHTYNKINFSSNLIILPDSTSKDPVINADISALLQPSNEYFASMRFFARDGSLQIGFSKMNQPQRNATSDILRFDFNLGFNPGTEYEIILGLQYSTFQSTSLLVYDSAHGVAIPALTDHSVTRFMFGFKYYL